MAENNSSSAGGVGIGSIVAGVLSYLKWHSVGYMILHAICGWIYVIYYAFKYGF